MIYVPHSTLSQVLRRIVLRGRLLQTLAAVALGGQMNRLLLSGRWTIEIQECLIHFFFHSVYDPHVGVNNHLLQS